MNEVKINKEIQLKNAPDIDGLVFRGFQGEADYPHIVRIVESCMQADDIDHSTSLEEISNNYKHLSNCDPFKDMLFAEVNGEVIGYSRVFWEKLSEGIRVYILFGNLKPAWRRMGIGTAMLKYNESCLNEIASTHPKDGPRYYQSWAADTEAGTNALLKRQGYKPIRYGFEMVRDLSKPFPGATLPAGLQIRPYKDEHFWPIVKAADEAFKDHWGYRPVTDEEFQGLLDDPNFRPELWKVAWDGDEVAGSVQNFYNPKENKEHNRKRGYTEGISTRRPWRKRGLATALIVESMKMFKEMGMTETAHGVDAENTSGALRLYKNLGYKVEKEHITYRKPMEGHQHQRRSNP